MSRNMPTASTKQVRELRDEAGAAGDLEMVRVCDRALSGSAVAWQECARVIAEAATRASEEENGKENA